MNGAALAIAAPAAPSTDWGAIGLVLLVAGTFLVGHAVLSRHPRDLVAERFGVRTGRLTAIREHIFQRLQIGVGFLYLLLGFGLELLARLRPPQGRAAFPVLGVAAVALATVALLALGWVWTSAAFRRYVRERLAASPGDLEADPALVREVGELFGVEAESGDSVASYAERVRRAAGLAPAPRTGPRETTARRVDEEEG